MRLGPNSFHRGALTATWLAALVALSSAQTPTGAVKGQVVDGHGARMLGVLVIIIPNSGGNELTTVTNISGAFLFSHLADDVYDFTFLLDVFRPAAAHSVVVSGAHATTIDAIHLTEPAPLGPGAHLGGPVVFPRSARGQRSRTGSQGNSP